jgi:hypothetical protein
VDFEKLFSDSWDLQRKVGAELEIGDSKPGREFSPIRRFHQRNRLSTRAGRNHFVAFSPMFTDASSSG